MSPTRGILSTAHRNIRSRDSRAGVAPFTGRQLEPKLRSLGGSPPSGLPVPTTRMRPRKGRAAEHASSRADGRHREVRELGDGWTWSPRSSSGALPSPGVRRLQFRRSDRRASSGRSRKPGLPQVPRGQKPRAPAAQTQQAAGSPAPPRTARGGVGAGPQQAPPMPRALPHGNRHNTTKWPPRLWAPEGSDGRASARLPPAGPLGSASPQ